VTLLIGVNNQYQGRSENEYRDEFSGLLNRSIELAGRKAGHVVVLSIPDWGVTPYAAQMGANPATVAKAIDRFNAINLSETKKAGAIYVDITAISRSRPDLVAGDGLHPSSEMYAQWVKSVLPASESALRN
jgi:lysophospholipase L1-like esterase